MAVGDVRREELFGRPVAAVTARAMPGYDPVCSCCPLVFSLVSQRLEYGDEWSPEPGELPDGADLALDPGSASWSVAATEAVALTQPGSATPLTNAVQAPRKSRTGRYPLRHLPGPNFRGSSADR